MPDRIRLDGRVAVVTGAAGVIGTATIRLLAERGARIVAVDRREQDLSRRSRICRPRREALAVAADVTQRGRGRRVRPRHASTSSAPSTPSTTTPASRATSSRSREYSLESFRRVLDVNVVGVFLGMKHVLPVMLKQNKGSIINTASIAGLMGSPMIAVYSASKHAVIGLTKSAAWECTGTGVRVNCVCPGLIDSRMLSDDPAGPQSRQRAAAERQDRRPDSGAPARTGVRSRLHRGVPGLRRGELRLRLRLYCRRRPHRRLIPSFRGDATASNPEPRDSGFADARPGMTTQSKRFSADARNSRSRCRRHLPGFPGCRPAAYETLTAPEAREYYRTPAPSLTLNRPSLNRTKPLSIPAPHGAIPARIYTPKTLRKNNGLAPCLVFFHGGGWVIGDLDTHEVVCQKLAA